MGSLRRIATVAATDLPLAFRSRRAVVMTLLFAAVSALLAYGLVSAFSAIEREVVSALRLPAAGNPGAVTMTLWRSASFSRIVSALVPDSLVFADIKGSHPLVLAYAFFMFHAVPLLTLLVTAPAIAQDVASGAARYRLVRATRTEWTLGKAAAEAFLLAAAMSAGAFSAWAVATFRMSAAEGVPLAPAFAAWTARAWLYAVAWLGLFLGISHLSRSAGKATAFSIFALVATAALPSALGNLAEAYGALSFLAHLDAFVPQKALVNLWRSAPAALLQGVVHAFSLAFLYLGIGSFFFARRDV